MFAIVNVVVVVLMVGIMVLVEVVMFCWATKSDCMRLFGYQELLRSKSGLVAETEGFD